MPLALIGAAALLVAAAVHVAQLISIFHAVPWLGPLFGADAIVSAALALVLLSNRRRRLAAAGGALVSAAALAGLALSSTAGLFGWHEELLRPAVVLAIASELIALAVLTPMAMPAPARRGAHLAAAAGLVAIGLLHVAAAGPEWGDTRGVFWMFMGLAGVCGALAIRLLEGLDSWSWKAVVALAALPFAGYLLSRSTGLPGATDDIGDWANPLGLAALAVEVALVPYAVVRLRISSSRELAVASGSPPSATASRAVRGCVDAVDTRAVLGASAGALPQPGPWRPGRDPVLPGADDR